MENKKVFAIIVNYNGLEDTIPCIDSLLDSSRKIEIVVVDNASRKNEGESIKKRYPDATVLNNTENLGFAGGNNIGIKYALSKNADFCLLVNNDTVVEKRMVELLLENADPNTVTVPNMYYYDYPDELWYGGGVINRFTGVAKHYRDKNFKRKCTFATGCCIMIPKEVFGKVGLLNDTYFMYCEDTEYSIRLNERGIRIKSVPEAKLWHKVGRSCGGENSDFSVYYMNRNRLFYIKNNRRFFHFTAYPFTIFTRYIRIIQYRCSNNTKWRVIRKAIKDYKKGITGKVDFLQGGCDE